MSRFLLMFYLLLIATKAFAYGEIVCGKDSYNFWYCYGKENASSASQARTIITSCTDHLTNCFIADEFVDQCSAISNGTNPNSSLFTRHGPTRAAAEAAADAACHNIYGSCSKPTSFCDRTHLADVEHPDNHSQLPVFGLQSLFPIQFLQLSAIWTGISFGLGVILVLIVYAKHATIINCVVHGRLPYKLPVYADDIQVLFKRTERVNWYGRVVFGLTTRLSMTERQLALVRRYWLGRVVAFDSFRRQRKNLLAKMHLQRAGQLSIPKYKKLPWIIAAILTVLIPIVIAVYFALRAIISFILGVFFIRVNIAKLARGTLIESHSLNTLMQAKDAVEETARYLKEYLELAATFDGQENIFEPK